MKDAPEPQDLESKLAQLDALQREIIRKTKALFELNMSMYRADFYIIGALRRLLALIKGFRRMVEDRNFLCAAPLVRMQLDTALRAFALTLVADRDALTAKLLDGAVLSKLKDDAGEKLRDAYVVDKLSVAYPWVKPLYAETSGFVHLSERHFFAAINKTDDETRVVHFSISEHDGDRDEAEYFEVVDAFHQATTLAGIVITGYFAARAHGGAAGGSETPV